MLMTGNYFSLVCVHIQLILADDQICFSATILFNNVLAYGQPCKLSAAENLCQADVFGLLVRLELALGHNAPEIPLLLNQRNPCAL